VIAAAVVSFAVITTIQSRRAGAAADGLVTGAGMTELSRR